MSLTGTLILRAKAKHDRTILSDCYYDGALKMSRPVYLEDGHPIFYLIHVGGGYVGGDLYNTRIVLDEKAEISLTTQSATKIYKTTKEPARQETEIRLKRDSFLSLVQDPLILYQDSQFVQTTTVYLEQGASFLMTDILTPGWAESGELFTYDWIRSKLAMYYEGRLVLLDHLYLKPAEQIESMMMMEGYTHFGSMLFVHEETTETFINQIQELLDGYDEEARIGISTLAIKGFILRVLARHTQVIEEIFTRCETYIREKALQKRAVCYRKY
ncbi:urease accessory protein UreD [Bacillus songklensis]|uniref:Urease accessory protein UreD n=1 Tax=Bacillus songklensis TaxID=1069116 RepID=A0ABV8BA94_9BACI